MHTHRDFFLQNPRLGMLIRTFDKRSADQKKEILDRAEVFLNKL
jgi:deoxyribodipyrimidine photolyase-related protein